MMMGTLTRAFHIGKYFSQLPKCFNFESSFNNTHFFPRFSYIYFNNIHTTRRNNQLMDFFDDKKNWGQNEVKVGRSWTTDELRIKSNSDLHKLWYVLLKENNMLLTMEHECNDKMELFPSPERIDKVKASMENLETVVRERNKAYYLLETGEEGERNQRLQTNQLGYNFFYKETEHLIPKEINKKWHLKHNFTPRGCAVNKFLLYYREKLWNEKRKKRNRDRNEVMHLLRRYPNINKTALIAKYPTANIDKIMNSGKCRGHYVP